MTEIVASATAPFEVEVVVYEEDTWMLMSASNVAREVRDSAEILAMGMADQQPHMVGDVVARGQKWYAIVNDIDDDHFDQASAIECAIDRVFHEAKRLRIKNLAIDVFGPDPDAFETMVRERETPAVERIWIKRRE